MGTSLATKGLPLSKPPKSDEANKDMVIRTLTKQEVRNLKKS